MARGRFLSKTISTDREANVLDDAGLCAWCMVIPHLDRDGLITGDPVLLWAEIAPRRDHWRARMGEFIQRWQELDMIQVYEDPSQGAVIWFQNFRKHQRIEYRKEAPSLFVAPPGYVREVDGLAVAVDVQMPLDGFPTGLTKSRVTLELVESKSRVSRELVDDQDQDQDKEQGKDKDKAQHQHQHQGPAGGVVADDVAAALTKVGIHVHAWEKCLEGMPDLTALDVVAWECYVSELNTGRPAQKRIIGNPGGFICGELSHGRRPLEQYYREAEDAIYVREGILK